MDATTGARAQPIYQTAAYVFEDSQHAADLFDLNRFGNTYTRIVNPTNAAFEERMAMLEGGVGALATASGMAATAITMLTLVSGGDGIVSSQNLYGGTHNQFALQLPRFGVDVRFVDPHDLDAVRAAIDERTRVLYAETIGNPRIDVLDIAGWAQIAEDAGLPLVIDNTFATPYLCRPFEHGAHIVVHSATKFIGGHGTSIGGVIVDSGRYDWERGLFPGVTEPSPGYRGMRFYETFGNFAFVTKARVETMRDFGPVLSPFNAFLLMQGLETLSLRMTRHVENARALAAFLRAHPRVHAVSYPDEPDSPYAAAAQRYLPLGPGRDPRVPHRGRARGRPALHRGLRAVLAPRQRRRRQDARDPPGLDHAPPARRGGARRGRRDRRHDPRLGRARGHRGHRLGRRARARGVGVSGAPQPARGRDQPVPAAARRQPGRLAAVGRGGVRARARARPARCCSRSATRPATGATSWSASRSRTRRRRSS